MIVYTTLLFQPFPVWLSVTIETELDSSQNPYDPSGNADKHVTREIEVGVQWTRRRWDIYFVPAIVIASILSEPISLLTGYDWLCFSHFGLLALWIVVRQLTPPKG